jgi:ABC-2 type transport system ATP-binding protein
MAGLTKPRAWPASWSARAISGPIAAVEEFVAGRTTWDRREIASQESLVLAATLNERDRIRARELRISLEPLSLQQAVVHAASAVGDEHKERTSA